MASQDLEHLGGFNAALNRLSDEGVRSLVDGFIKDSHGLDKDEIGVVEFVFWMSASVEHFLGRTIQSMLGSNENRKIRAVINPKFLELRGEILQQVTNDLYLHGKSKLLNKVISTMTGKKLGKTDSFLREIHDLRNAISHNRLKDLRYKNKPLKSVATRKKMIEDYWEIFEEISLKDVSATDESTSNV